MHSTADVAGLDEVIAATWPAPEAEELAGWRLRFGHGFTGRANSAWPRRDDGSMRLPDRIASVERFYRRHGLCPKVQLSPASEPAGLDGELAAQGYERSTEVLVETLGSPPDVRPPAGVLLATEPDALWLDVWFAVRGYPRARAPDVLPMLRGDAVFARVDDVAVGRAAVHGGWAAITSMATRPGVRRSGHARAILSALIAWAREREARLCLAVDATNDPARALYEDVGFAPRYAYWYRTLPA
jgi:GNAT superfamily N-acetyltransferase